MVVTPSNEQQLVLYLDLLEEKEKEFQEGKLVLRRVFENNKELDQGKMGPTWFKKKET